MTNHDRAIEAEEQNRKLKGSAPNIMLLATTILFFSGYLIGSFELFLIGLFGVIISLVMQ